MNVLVIDIGGTHIKVASTQTPVPIKIVSGPTMSAKEMTADILSATADWQYDAVSIGYPGPVRDNQPAAEPHNLASGWVDFDYGAAFGKPIRFINDAAMQALGGYVQGRMLFLGIGTGLGTALVFDGVLVPLELAHLPYRKGKTYEDYVGLAGLERRGKRKWRKSVLHVVEILKSAFVVDSVLLGGGNAKLMDDLPAGVTIGANSNAILGGIRLWDQGAAPVKATGNPASTPTDSRGSSVSKTNTTEAEQAKAGSEPDAPSTAAPFSQKRSPNSQGRSIGSKVTRTNGRKS